MEIGREVIPLLRMIVGPTPGRLFPLDRPVTQIGRAPESHIVLKPRYISKRHATIERTPEGFLLFDHSYAGTTIAGEKIARPIRLDDGMIFSICDVSFSFHANLVPIQDEHAHGSTIMLSRDASSSSSSSSVLARGKAVDPEEKLRLVLEISRGLARSLNLGEVLDQLLESLFQVFPTTQRGFVLLRNEPNGAFIPRAMRGRRPGVDGLAISRAVLDRVTDERHAILIRDARLEFSASESVNGHLLRSLMCAPLLDAGHVPIGVIQLDTADGSGRYNQKDLDLLVAVASQTSIAVEHARLHEATFKRVELEHEMRTARAVLDALLPEPPTGLIGCDYWSYYEPARYVGGDYYGHFPLPRPDEAADGPVARWAVAVGDVAGKGMPAALLMAKFSAEARVVLQTVADPARAVGRLNRMLCETGTDEMFVTFLLAVIDTDARTLQVVNAGHANPIFRRVGGPAVIVREAAPRLPLGLEPDEVYSTIALPFEPGDLITLYTDGVADAINAARDPFGTERLRAVVESTTGSVDTVGDAILQAIRRHVAGYPQSDDITLVCLRIRPATET